MTDMRILVVLDPTVEGEQAVMESLELEASEVFIVTALLPTRLAWLTNDDRAATAAAAQRLDAALKAAESIGVKATGAVGTDDDLLTVIGDALAEFPADEIVVVTSRPDHEHHWRVDDLAATVQERHSIGLRHVEIKTPDDAGATDPS